MDCCGNTAFQHRPTTASQPPPARGQQLYFVQWCPTCGRAVRTLVALLGKQVACHHCGCGFVASGDSPDGPPQRSGNLQRAEQLLAHFDSRRGRLPTNRASAHLEQLPAF